MRMGLRLMEQDDMRREVCLQQLRQTAEKI